MRNIFLLLCASLILALIPALVSACSTFLQSSAGTPQSPGSYTYDWPDDSIPLSEINAVDLVSRMRIGWNLANTLETSDLHWLSATAPVSDYEKAWGQPLTTKDIIDAVKKAGFNTIRIPVSWNKCVDSEYRIREDWMERVKEIVGFAIANEMFIILNTHHDESIFKFMNAEMEESKKAFGAIWKQIAENFKDYGGYLIFEGLNEPRTRGSPREWGGGTIEEHNNLNEMLQLFVDTVRASGGNNAYRILMVTPYAASSVASAMSALKIPNDTVENRIIVSVHAYAPYNFALDENSPVNTWDRERPGDTAPITEAVNRAYNLFVSKGIPVIMGEMAAKNKNNEAARAQWAEFYVSYARSKGIPCVWWDDGDRNWCMLYDRRNNEFPFPEILAALMRGTT